MAGLRPRTRLEEEVVVVDHEFEAQRREVVGEVSAIVVAGKEEQIAAGTGAAEQGAPAQQFRENFAQCRPIVLRDVGPETRTVGIGRHGGGM